MGRPATASGAYVIATALSGLDEAALPLVDLTGLPGASQGPEWYARSAAKGSAGPVVAFRLVISGSPDIWPAHAALPGSAPAAEVEG